MINSINFIDGLDGLSSGIAFIAAVTLGLISLTTGGRPAAHRRPVLRRWPASLLGFLRWNFHPASIFIGTSGVQFVGYTLAVLAILGTAKVAVALLVLGVPIIDTFWIIVRRLSQGRSPFSPDRRPHPPPAARPRAVAPPDGPRRSTGSASRSRSCRWCCPGVDQLYAFLGVFVAFGLVLFIPTRGALRRPDELEADSYEPDPRDERERRPDA